MAVTNELTFGGIDSTDYGVVIAGYGEYGAPKRATESYSIPGRNGAFLLDLGYFENITIEYEVVVKASTQQEFREAVSDYRNAIVALRGYQRLEDVYHPNEYRMAMYEGGFDDAPSFHGSSAVFKIKFNCKPQRYLTSGETAVTVANNGTITNPTLFDAEPLLAVKGYGKIGFNGYEIDLAYDEVGSVWLSDADTVSGVNVANATSLKFNSSLVDVGDTVIMHGGLSLSFIAAASTTDVVEITGFATGQTPSTGFPNAQITKSVVDATHVSFTIVVPDDITFSYNNSSSDVMWNATLTAVLKYNDSNQTEHIENGTMYLVFQVHTGTPSSSRVFLSASLSGLSLKTTGQPYERYFGAMDTESSQSILGNPTYIDCSIGEAYKLQDGEPVSLDGYIDLGSELPKLAPGTNRFTKDNSITELKVTPRWWQV